MKTLRFVFWSLCIFLLSTGWASCSDDEEEQDAARLVGSWETIRYEGYEQSVTGDYYEWDDEVTDGDIIVFRADGTGTSNDDVLSWQLDGDRLTIVSNGETNVFTVLELEASRFVMEYYDNNGESVWYQKVTCRRIN